MAKAPKNYNPIVWQYEEDVLSGKIVAGRLLKLAIRRHRKDLREGAKRGLYFDPEAAQAILDFGELVNLEPDTPIVLFPFQQWELYAFYGWQRRDGTRRFRKKYKSCARGNGKTPMEALQILYHLAIDGPYKAEAYVSANKEEQAKICFGDVKAMLTNSPELQDVMSASAEQIYCPENSSKFRFLTSNPSTADGSRPTYAVLDEYHEFENDKMTEVLSSGLIKKKNSVLSIITTRGFHKDWPCAIYERKVAIPTLEGSLINDDLFVVIYTQDSEDEFDKPETWQKSNPMLCEGGVLDLVTLIRERDDKINNGEESVVAFKTKNLNWWCDAPTSFVAETIWIKSGTKWKEEEVYGMQCWGGLDMAQTNDFCALALFFPPEDWQVHECDIDDDKAIYVRSPIRVPGKYRMLWRFWIPEAKKQQRISNGLHALRDWEKDGHIRLLEGNVIDPREIEKDIISLSEIVDIRQLMYDRYNCNSTAIALNEQGISSIDFPQTMAHFTTPTKNFRDLVLQKRLDHGHNPIATWMMRNSVPITDTNGNIKITKDPKRAPEKVDGIVAGIMALGSWMSDTLEDSSIYDKRGFIEL
ncbi:terminase large subunit [Larkinella humicola]|uniref:Terminase large subunit n=1 Tax=Larkinella humicola TaxID=2607654 RepID=A0A5N1JL63_9BACT|nr:terminase large subunit [Larkinella humicola]KAA9357225.1 terminase large subunit [Larkinella humicola]